MNTVRTLEVRLGDLQVGHLTHYPGQPIEGRMSEPHTLSPSSSRYGTRAMRGLATARPAPSNAQAASKGG